MKATLGISSKHTRADALGSESLALYREGEKVYDSVLLIDPRKVSYQFVRGSRWPVLSYEGEDISDLHTLIVRSTSGVESAVATLVRALKLCGCRVIDPVERFSIGKASKILTTITRFKKGVGTSSYISFSRCAAEELLRSLDDSSGFPLVTKPVFGRRGVGLQVLRNLEEGLGHMRAFFGNEEYSAEPILWQQYVTFVREFRLLIMDGRLIGMVEKFKESEAVAANAFQGAVFREVREPAVIEKTLDNVSAEGLLGVDVAVDIHGEIHIIEANRAPQWAAFERATGINVAALILDRLKARLIAPSATSTGTTDS